MPDPVCSKCITGFIHDGEPKGTVTSIAGLPTYVAKPVNTRGKPGVIVIVPDVFGWEFINNRLLADAYAEKSGRTIYLPDVMNGEAPSSDFMNMMRPIDGTQPSLFRKIWGFVLAMYNAGPFLYFHRASVTGPIVKNFFTILRTENPDLKIGVAGFCWGGKYAILLGQEHFSDIHLVDAVFAAHPSMLAIPADVQQPFAPVSIAIAGKDHSYTPKVGEQVEEMWKKGDFSKWEQIVYKDAEHGYAVRGNMNDPTQKEDMEKAIDQAVTWFGKYLS